MAKVRLELYFSTELQHLLPSSTNSGTKRLFGHIFLSLLTGKEKLPSCSMKWQMLKIGKSRLLSSLNEMLNVILYYNPFLTFQSCRAPSNCNYTFLYLSIMGTPYYMLIYNRLRLSKNFHMNSAY